MWCTTHPREHISTVFQVPRILPSNCFGCLQRCMPYLAASVSLPCPILGAVATGTQKVSMCTTHTIHQLQPLPTATRVLKTGSTASHNNVPCMDSILQSCPAFLRRNKSIVGGCCQQTQGYNVVAIFFPIGSVVPHTCPTQES